MSRPDSHALPVSPPLPAPLDALRVCLPSASSLHASSTVRNTSLSLPDSFLLSRAPLCASCHLSTALATSPCAFCTAATTSPTIFLLLPASSCLPNSGIHPASTSSRCFHLRSLSAASSPACRRIRASYITFRKHLLCLMFSCFTRGTAPSMSCSALTSTALVSPPSGRPLHSVSTCCSVASGAPVLYSLVSGLRIPACRRNLSVVVCTILGSPHPSWRPRISSLPRTTPSRSLPSPCLSSSWP